MKGLYERQLNYYLNQWRICELSWQIKVRIYSQTDPDTSHFDPCVLLGEAARLLEGSIGSMHDVKCGCYRVTQEIADLPS
jgi:hypothetical protein